jgi:peptide/nickel transport system substrate-binding protein
VPVPTPVVAPAGQARPGGTLRIGQVGDLVSLDPLIHGAATADNVGLSFDKLVALDLQDQPGGLLAESWDVSEDAKQIQLNLRHGVQFHSGRELTSDDVAYTFARIRDDPKAGTGQFALQGQWFTSYETPDKYTIILKSDQPRPTMFDLLAYLPIVDRMTLESPDAASKSVGTGPFKFVEWAPGDHVTFDQNTNYWQSGRPYVAGIRTSIFRDVQSMTAQFEAGALDLIRMPTLRDFVRLKESPNFQGITHPLVGYSAYNLGVNVLTPPTDSKLVRQALNYAIDRQRFVDTALLGLGHPQDLPWSEKYPMYESGKMVHYAFDLEKARSLLAQAGASDLSVDINPFPPAPEAELFAEMYQADLAQIGVTLNIVKLETPAWVAASNSGKMNGMYVAPGTNLHLLPGTLFNLSVPLRPMNNMQNYKSDAYTALVARAGSEVDPAKQQQIYSALNDLLLEESFVMCLSPFPLVMLARANVHDVTPNLHDGAWLQTNTWLDS